MYQAIIVDDEPRTRAALIESVDCHLSHLNRHFSVNLIR